MFLFIIVFEDPSKSCSLKELHSNKRNRGRDKIEQEIVPPHKKSKQSESSVVDVNQSPSFESVKYSPVHCPIPDQQPHTREQSNPGTVQDRFLSSEINAEKHGNTYSVFRRIV